MKIVIETIPHNDQRYDTVGDWFTGPDGTLNIRVSEMSNPRHEFLVALHELVEVQLCSHAGVTQQQVDDFDMKYEAERLSDDLSEPGDSLLAPYHKQHVMAENIERQMALALDVPWNDYMKEVESL